MNSAIRKRETLLMIAILIAAFAMRIVNIRYGYPLQIHPDEPVVVEAALDMIQTGDLNPHNFQYPSFTIYLQALLFYAVLLPAKLFGVQLLPARLVDFHVYARALNVVLSTATIYVVYVTGRRLFNAWTGLAAMCFLAVSPAHVMNAYYATVDTPTAFWSSVACLMAVLIYTNSGLRKPWHYLVGGMCVGFATSSKYTAFVAFLPILVAHACHARRGKPWIDINILSGLVAAPVGFLVTTPYALLDFNTFFDGLLFQSRAYTSHLGAESESVTSFHLYFNHLFSEGYGALPLLLAFLGFGTLLYEKRWEAWVLISFPLALFLFLGLYRVYFSRNILPAVPSLALLSGFGVIRIIEWGGTVRLRLFKDSPGYRYTAAGVIALLCLLSVSSQIRADMKMIRDNTLPDTRWVSLRWILQNIPPGTSIARELYTPPIEMYSGVYPITHLGLSGVAMTERPREPVRIVIVSSSDYERFVDHPDQYPKYAQAYNDFFGCNQLLKEFSEDGATMSGPTIRIYLVKYGWDFQACTTQNRPDRR